MDLVLMSDKADPPICKLLDYKKYLYDQQKKAKQAKKTVQQLKEIRLGNHIANNDIIIKAKNIDRILKDGDKVKISVIYKGREARFVASGVEILSSLLGMVAEVHTVDKQPQIEGNRAYMIISPKK